MSPRKPAWTGLLAAALLVGCVDPFLAPEPEDGPVAVFESFWSEFDAHYSYFMYKGIDWDSVYDVYRPRVEDGMSATALADLLGEIIVGLEDGHVELYADGRRFAYTAFYDQYPDNYDPGTVRAIVHREVPSANGGRGLRHAPGVAYGWLTDRIAYLGINSFGDPAIRDGIDDALAAVAEAEAIVLDLRSNGGGSDLNSDAVIGRLIDRPLLYRRYAFRNGPEHDDFTDFIDGTVEPAGDERFLGPLAVLTNRRVFSTGETFALAMRARADRHHTVLVGDTTGGGFGNPLGRELPNGWKFRVSRWLEVDLDGNNYEGVGLPPDIVAAAPAEELAALRDPIIEAAMANLRGELPQ